MRIRKRIGWIAVLLGVLLLAMTALPALADGLAGVWAGRRTLQDQPETELTLTDLGNNVLHMEAFFYRMCFIEADIYTDSDSKLYFTDYDGEMDGSLTRNADGSVILVIDGGPALEPGEFFYDYFAGREFLFIGDGSGQGTADADEEPRMSILTAASAQPSAGEEYQLSDTFRFRRDGTLDEWTHVEYDGGQRTETRRQGNQVTVNGYDENGKKVLMQQYQNGELVRSEETVWKADGNKASERGTNYLNGEEYTTVLYYDYNENGQHVATRCINTDGMEFLQEAYEYEPDGSFHVTSWADYAHSSDTPSKETWYDSRGQITRTVTWRDGEISMEMTCDRAYDENGKVLWETCDQSGVPVNTAYLRDANGQILLKTTTSSSSGWNTLSQEGYERNENEQTVYRFQRDVNTDAWGGTSWTVDDTEYDLDTDGKRILCYSTYRKSHYNDNDLSDRALSHRTFELYQGDQGNILGVSPFPRRGTAYTTSMSLQDFEYTCSMRRRDVMNEFEGQQVSGSICDAGIAVEYCGYPGALRFVFGGKDSNRLESIWWVSDDPTLDQDILLNLLEGDGFQMGRGTGNAQNPLGSWEYKGEYGENGEIVIASVPDENLTYFCLSFRWEEEEPDIVRRWDELLNLYQYQSEP